MISDMRDIKREMQVISDLAHLIDWSGDPDHPYQADDAETFARAICAIAWRRVQIIKADEEKVRTELLEN